MELGAFINFIQMGGYGSYVWSAYVLTLMMLACSYGYARLRFRKSYHLASLGAQDETEPAARTVTFKKVRLSELQQGAA